MTELSHSDRDPVPSRRDGAGEAFFPVSLRFVDDGLEAEYRRSFARERRGQLGLGVVLLGILWALFGIVDHAVFVRHFTLLAWLRYGVFLPLMLVSWPVFLSPKLSSFFERRAQEVLLYLGAVATAGILAMGAATTVDSGSREILVGSLGLLVTLTFLYGFSPMRFVYALGLGLFATAVGFLLLLRALSAPPLLWATLAVFALAVNGAGGWVSRVLERLARLDFARRRAILRERERSERLLSNALPLEIARRLLDEPLDLGKERAALAERHEDVTVVFADLVGFTPLAEKLSTEQLADLLSRLFGAFDALALRHGVEKIKTLGDAWLGASGVPHARRDHARRGLALAQDMVRAVAELRDETKLDVSVRVGVHSGSAVSGVIGRTRFAYDLWGEAVDGAKAMESGGVPGRVRVSEATRALLDRVDLEGPDASGRYFVRHG